MFRKAVRQEGLEPAGLDSAAEEMTHRGVVRSSSSYSDGIINFILI